MKTKVLQYLGVVAVLVFLSGCVANKNISQQDIFEKSEIQTVEGSTTPTQEQEKPNQKVEDKVKGTIKVIPEFYSPELDTENIVRIYLPPDYEESEKRYPVIYMLDGQNLFDSSTASYQKEWHVDESLDALYEENRTNGIIVVGVDSVGSRRNKEYNLYLNSHEGDGKGNVLELCDFYANTLKQYIDDNYRTLEDREHTAIIGASYGAVASVCSSIRYPEVYGYTGMFSYYDNQNPEKMTEYLKNNMTAEILTDNKIYFYTGKYDFAYKSTEAAYEIAKENEIKNILYVFDEGQHDEYAWGGKFENCLEFFGWIE